MKRILIVLIVVLATFSMSGCAKVIKLTDEENYLIAEYAASLLVKYDKNIDDKYEDAYLQSEYQSTEIEETTEVTTEEVTEDTETTEEVTEEPTTEKTTEATTEDKKDEADKETTEATTEGDSTTEAGGGNDTAAGNSDVNVDNDFDIAEFAGVDCASIRYAYYAVLEQYPSYDKEGMYIEITAPEGYKLLVIKFDIENKTNDNQYIDMFKADLGYNIIINDRLSAKQMLTILMDDLYTYQANIGGSMRQEAVLLFQISDSIVEDLNSIKLKITNNGTEKIMQLK